MYVRKEAVLSSMIEGTQSSLSDLLHFETDHRPGAPMDEDVNSVSHYVAALQHGIERLNEGFPLSLRLFKKIHEILLRDGRGSTQTPGEFRHSQNWIGGTRPGNALYVPPPADKVMECMGQLENFLHSKSSIKNPLLTAALSHLQFETIHPFLDGNGRLGRLLIVLILHEGKILHHPMLYLSLYFKEHRQTYYQLLNQVRETGEWEIWLEFFADAVIQVTKQATETVHRIQNIIKKDKAVINNLGRIKESCENIHQILLTHPIITAKKLTELTHKTPRTINKCLTILEENNIIKETTGKKRDRIYCYQEYLDVFSEGI
jgi:Fic family protein